MSTSRVGVAVCGLLLAATGVAKPSVDSADWPRSRAIGLHYDSSMVRLRAGVAVVLALIVVVGVVSVAQRFGVFEGAGAGIRVPPKDFNDGGFTICKWMFRSDRSEAGGIGWSTDYPFGEINLLTRLSGLTKVWDTPVWDRWSDQTQSIDWRLASS